MFPDVTLSGIVTFIIILLISISVHETMHAYVAHKLGDSTAHDMGRISLNPLAHVDLLTTVILPVITLLIAGTPILAAKPVMVSVHDLKYGDFGWAMVSAAGPLSNLAMAVIAALAINAGLVPQSFIATVLWFVSTNIGLFVFNMLPLPPLDGSRVLRAFAPESVQELMDRYESMGFAITLFVLILLMNPLSQFIVSANRAILNVLF